MGALAKSEAQLRWRGELIGSGKKAIDALRRCVIDHRIGMLWWLTDYVRSSNHRHPDAVAMLSEEFDTRRSPTASDRQSPFYHLIELEFEHSSILFIPAGDPETKDFLDTSLAFSIVDFFDPNIHDGGEVLNTFYRHIIQRWEKHPIRYLLLDQDAGQTLTAAINFGTAQTNVIISKLDEQSRAGLRSLVEQTGALSEAEWGNGVARTNIRVVMSQYDGRHHAMASRWWESAANLLEDEEHLLSEDERTTDSISTAESAFQRADKARCETVVELKRMGIDPKQHMFVVDFDREAVQKEHLFPEWSPSYSELTRLAVSLAEPTAEASSEESGDPTESKLWVNHGTTGRGKSRVRILGERIHGSAGTFDAFADWMSSVGVEVDRVGWSHEAIVASVEAAVKGDLSLSEFDVVALPAYARLLWDEGFESLDGPGTDAPHAQDCAGPITEKYLEHAILGWSEYARFDGRLLGYPLFMDCPLILVNVQTVNDKFFWNFRAQEDRLFRGFEDPADFRDVVRSAATNTERGDQLIMTLNGESIAPWYEWLAIVAMFGGDPDLHGLGGGYGAPTVDGAGRFLDDPCVIRATLRYLELVSYADRRSYRAGWSYAIQQMSNSSPTNSVGMTLAWPDAPPDTELPEKFQYAVPPGLSVSDCWLLCIPRHRRGRLGVREIEYLMQRFLTYDEQYRLVRDFRGLPVHQSVLNDVDLWHSFRHLSTLSAAIIGDRLSMSRRDGRLRGRLRRRPVGPRAVQLARLVRDALVRLCEWTIHEIDERKSSSSPVALWHTQSFLDRIRGEIETEFRVCVARFAKIG
jgi:hypothetical protein